MTKIKLCGLTRESDISAANILLPEYVGFVFAKKSRRYISIEKASALRRQLSSKILAVGVFVDEEPKQVATLLNEHIIDIAQLHGNEDEDYIGSLRQMSDKPLIKAFRMGEKTDFEAILNSHADYVLLDSQTGGSGKAFDWEQLKSIRRPYFLAGGLNICNVKEAVEAYHPYAVDVSSGIETDGKKDEEKMKKFVYAVRSIK